ncbi:HNH endonuclease [Bacillus rhizoplanae]|uniref:HNH endonuclease n=1 Tax=Bacillus rhizoplanae TaxID=2880966 RepID=UPI003D2263F0
MDVHYKPDAWQEMKEGIDKLTKDALMELKNANDLLEKIESKIHSLDSDRSIHFQHTSQQGKINQLLDDYITLGNYCTKAGEAVSRHIDEPFYKDMDKFAGKMRDLSIRNYSTKNRIGSTSTTTLPNAHGYGMAQTITTKKDKITVDDIFKDSLAFDKVLRAQYKEIKQENPDAKLDYAEYRKLVPSMRGFEYKTREDEQKKLETWRDLAIGAGLIILTIACPPAGLTASALYGGLQIKSAYDGKDWGTGRKLSDAERAENGIFGALDAIPVLGTAAKGFKGLDSAASLAKLSKMQDAGKVFNPNTGKNVVQSLRDSKNIGLHNLKITGWKTADKINDWDHAIKSGVAKVVDGTTGGFNIAKDFVLGKSLAPVDGVMGLRRGTNWEAAVKVSHDESKGIIHNKISKLEESVVGKGTGKVRQIKEIDKEAFEKAMVEAVRSQPPYTRKPNKPRNYKNKVRNEDGTTTFTFISKKNGKEYNVTYDKAGFPIFNSKFEKDLPEKLYLETDAIQFEHLSRLLYKEIQGNPDLAKRFTNEEIKLLEAGRVPQTLTWHHHQQPGKMQIVDYFEHQAASHTGGRAIWGGGEAGRKGEIKKRILEMISWD